MVSLHNALCPNLAKARPRSKAQRLAWCRVSHLYFTTHGASIFNTTCNNRSHQNIHLVTFSATSAPSSPLVPSMRWSLVVGFLWQWWWWTFAILNSSRNLLSSIHGVLQMGLDNKMLFWALPHLSHWHVHLLCWVVANGYTKEEAHFVKDDQFLTFSLCL